ncbi:hypothetical protein GGG16DRAFT_116054 [Schizophyllum commune]
MPRLWSNIVVYPVTDPQWRRILAHFPQPSKAAATMNIHLAYAAPRDWGQHGHLADGHDPYNWTIAEPLLRENMSRCEVLHADSDIVCIPLRVGGTFTIFKNAPNLSCLRVQDVPLDQLDLPWAQLLMLHASTRTLSSCVIALSQCHKLRRLAIHSMVFDYSCDIGILTLPCLQSLYLHNLSFGILYFLIAPSLRQIEFFLGGKEDAMDDPQCCGNTPALLRFAKNNPDAGAVVNYLNMTSIDDWESKWLELLTIYRGLTILRIEQNFGSLGDPDDVTRSLLRTLAYHDALPELRSLQVWAFDIFSDTNMTALEDFVKHRVLKHPVDQRKSIGLEIGETKSEHSDRLQRLRESGVAIYINDDGAPKPPGQTTYGTDTDPLEERCFDTCGGFGFDSDDEVFS